jgi:hypothetical protein
LKDCAARRAHLGDYDPDARLAAGGEERWDAPRTQGEIRVEDEDSGCFRGVLEPNIDRRRKASVVRPDQDFGSAIAAEPGNGVIRRVVVDEYNPSPEAAKGRAERRQ